MKITLAQLNPRIGDFSAILTKLKNAIETAVTDQADLIVFPELSLTGYSPKDLLLSASFQEQVAHSLEVVLGLSRQYPDLGILVGAPHPCADGEKYDNAALLFYRGALIFKQQKTLLPFYDVFDEPRYFESAKEVSVIAFKGEILGISVCEDAWKQHHKSYEKDPIDTLVKKGATLIINLTASPFELGKAQVRQQVFCTHAIRHKLPVLMVNQVGGQDHLIFDGGSFFLNAQGEAVFQAPFFKEFVHTIETTQPPVLNSEEQLVMMALYEALVLGIRDYVYKCGFSSIALGLSGGIDSAVVACLAVAALGKEQVTGILMPSAISSSDSVTDAAQLAHHLGIQTHILPIASLFTTAVETLAPLGNQAYSYNLTEQNLQARLRGVCLMAYSNQTNCLVLATGNKSELAVGYSTLYGDMNGALLPLGDVYKTQVYELARLINQTQVLIPENTLTKPPSAELSPNQKDQDTLPPYEILDAILFALIEENQSETQIVESSFLPETVKWVQKALKRSEYKRFQAASILKVSKKAFGPGRRLPIAVG